MHVVHDRSRAFEGVLATWRRGPDLYRIPDDAWPKEDGCDCYMHPPQDSTCCSPRPPELSPPSRPTIRQPHPRTGADTEPGPRAGGTSGPRFGRGPHRQILEVTDLAIVEERHLAPVMGRGISTLGAHRSGVSSSTGLPCNPDLSYGPPPPEVELGPEWLAWWGDCVPVGPVGPGAASCDPEEIYWDAVLWCAEDCVADLGASGQDEIAIESYERCFSLYYVSYAWVDADCAVIDAVCGTTSEGSLDDAWWLAFEWYGYGETWDYPWYSAMATAHGWTADPPTPEQGSEDAGDVSGDVFDFTSGWTQEEYDDYENGLEGLDRLRYDTYLDLYRDNPELRADALVDCQDPAWFADNEQQCVAAMAAEEEGDTGTAPATDDTSQFMDPLGSDDPCGDPFLEC